MKLYIRAARVPKMITEYVVQGYYGRWEDLTASDSYQDAKDDLKAYRENERGTSFRLVERKVENPEYIAPENTLTFDSVVNWIENESPYDFNELYMSYPNKNYTLRKAGAPEYQSFVQVFVYEDNTASVRNIETNRTKQVYSLDELIAAIEKIESKSRYR